MTGACGKWEEISTAWNQIDTKWEDIGLCDTHDGADGGPKFHLPIYVGDGHRKQPIGNLIKIYDEAKQLDNTQDLLSIIEPYIEELVVTPQRPTSLPDFNEIDIENLLKNQTAIERLLDEMAKIDARIKAENKRINEDDLLLILISACV